MEKETLLSGFTSHIGAPGEDGYIGDTGISQRTLDEYVTNILPTVTSDEMVNDGFYELHSKILRSMGGQMRHERSEFVKNYKPTQTEPPKNGGTGKTPDDGGLMERIEKSNRELAEKLNAALESMNKMKSEHEAEIAAQKREKLFETCVSRLRDKIEDAGGRVNDGLLNIAKTLTAYQDTMDADGLTNALQAEYEKQYKAVYGDGSSPLSGHASGGGGKSYIETLKERDKAHAELIEEMRKTLK